MRPKNQMETTMHDVILKVGSFEVATAGIHLSGGKYLSVRLGTYEFFAQHQPGWDYFAVDRSIAHEIGFDLPWLRIALVNHHRYT